MVKNHFGEIKFPERFNVGEIVSSNGQQAVVIRRYGFDFEGRQIVKVVCEDGTIIQGNVRKLPNYGE